MLVTLVSIISYLVFLCYTTSRSRCKLFVCDNCIVKTTINMMHLLINDYQTLLFIEYCEMEEVLWNTSVPMFGNREAVKLAAVRIAEAMNIEGFGFKNVITKFENLKLLYNHEVQKIAEREKSGASAREMSATYAVWYTKMDSFLKPTLPTLADDESDVDSDGVVDDVLQIKNKDQILNTVSEEPDMRDSDKNIQPQLNQNTVQMILDEEDKIVDPFGNDVARMLCSIPITDKSLMIKK